MRGVPATPSVRVTQVRVKIPDTNGVSVAVQIGRNPDGSPRSLSEHYFAEVRQQVADDTLASAYYGRNQGAVIDGDEHGNFGSTTELGKLSFLVGGPSDVTDQRLLITLYECVADHYKSGFQLAGVTEHALPSGTASVDQTSDVSPPAGVDVHDPRVSWFLSAKTTGTAPAWSTIHAMQVYAQPVSGSNLLRLTRHQPGTGLEPVDVAIYWVRWGAEWEVQHHYIEGWTATTISDALSTPVVPARTATFLDSVSRTAGDARHEWDGFVVLPCDLDNGLVGIVEGARYWTAGNSSDLDFLAGNSFAVEALARLKIGGGDADLVSKWNVGTGEGYRVRYVSGEVTVDVSDGTDTDTLSHLLAPDDVVGGHVHIEFQYHHGDPITLYVAGAVVDSGILTPGLDFDSSGAEFKVGGSGQLVEIERVSVHRADLDPATVKDDRDDMADSLAGARGIWKFKEAIGPAIDSHTASTAHDLTVVDSTPDRWGHRGLLAPGTEASKVSVSSLAADGSGADVHLTLLSHPGLSVTRRHAYFPSGTWDERKPPLLDLPRVARPEETFSDPDEYAGDQVESTHRAVHTWMGGENTGAGFGSSRMLALYDETGTSDLWDALRPERQDAALYSYLWTEVRDFGAVDHVGIDDLQRDPYASWDMAAHFQPLRRSDDALVDLWYSTQGIETYAIDTPANVFMEPLLDPDQTFTIKLRALQRDTAPSLVVPDLGSLKLMNLPGELATGGPFDDFKRIYAWSRRLGEVYVGGRSPLCGNRETPWSAYHQIAAGEVAGPPMLSLEVFEVDLASKDVVLRQEALRRRFPGVLYGTYHQRGRSDSWGVSNADVQAGGSTSRLFDLAAGIGVKVVFRSSIFQRVGLGTGVAQPVVGRGYFTAAANQASVWMLSVMEGDPCQVWGVHRITNGVTPVQFGIKADLPFDRGDPEAHWPLTVYYEVAPDPDSGDLVARIYLDGKLLKEESASAGYDALVVDSGYHLRAAADWGVINLFDGLVAEVGIYDRPTQLTQDQVLELSNSAVSGDHADKFGLVWGSLLDAVSGSVIPDVLGTVDGGNVSGHTIHWSSALSGGEDLRGKPVPVALGKVRNVEPFLLDPYRLIYFCGYPPIFAIDRAMLNMQELSLDTAYDWPGNLHDWETFAESAPAADKYNTWGPYLKLNALPALPDGATLTVDVRGLAKSQGANGLYEIAAQPLSFSHLYGDVLKQVITQLGVSPISDSDLDEASWNEVLYSLQHRVGRWISDQESVRECAERLAQELAVGLLVTQTGLIGVQRWTRQRHSPDALELEVQDGLLLGMSPSALSDPLGSAAVVWGRNWAPSVEAAGAAADADKVFASAETRKVQALPLAAYRAEWPDAEPIEVGQGFLARVTDALEHGAHLVRIRASDDRHLLTLSTKGLIVDESIIRAEILLKDTESGRLWGATGRHFAVVSVTQGWGRQVSIDIESWSAEEDLVVLPDGSNLELEDGTVWAWD